MFSYESGVFIALCLWVFSLVSLIIKLNSLLNKNLNKIGLRISWTTQTPVPIDGFDDKNKALKLFLFILLTLCGLAYVITSWLYVVLFLLTLLYAKSKDYGAPEKIKNYRWMLKNVDMPVEKILQEIYNLDEHNDISFSEFKEQSLKEIEERRSS